VYITLDILNVFGNEFSSVEELVCDAFGAVPTVEILSEYVSVSWWCNTVVCAYDVSLSWVIYGWKIFTGEVSIIVVASISLDNIATTVTFFANWYTATNSETNITFCISIGV
jgi:hypothetical protein